jgi:biopolymer transport protein ExbD
MNLFLRKVLPVLIAFLLLGTSLGAQRRPRPRPVVKLVPVRRVPQYQFHLQLHKDHRMFVSMVSEPLTGEIGPGDLAALITDLPTGGDKFNTPDNEFPRVVIEADPALTMLAIWNPVTLFRRGTDISLSIRASLKDHDNIEVKIPWDAPEADINVKPNPLSLMVKIADNGTLSLNGDPFGSITDTKQLTARLKEIFKEREDNGVFREASNEVEKSVTILMGMSDRRFSDVVTVARDLTLAGSDRISLSMGDTLEEPDAIFDRKSILDIPPVVPRPKKKP